MAEPSPGLLRKKSRRPLEDLDVLAQRPVLPPQPRQLRPLIGRQTWPLARVGLGLGDPGPHCGLGQVKVAGDLPDRAVTSPAPLHDLRLELRRERPAAARLLPLHGLHDEHPSARGRTPDGECPSNRRKPRPITTVIRPTAITTPT